MAGGPMVLPHPFETISTKLGGEAGEVMVRDLLCAEALSPNTYCPTRALPRDDAHSAPSRFETSRLCPSSPHRGSSFPSKIGEIYSPRSVHQHKCSQLCATTCRDPVLRCKPAGNGTSVVADFIITPRPAFEELGEAMRVLQKRQAQASYKLTNRYVGALMEPDMAGESSFEVCTVRRKGVFHIFKLVAALRLRNLIAAHAVAYLDRFLNTLTVSALVNPASAEKAGATSAMEFQYIATACVSIAAKMDATAAPSLASLSRYSGEAGTVSEGKLRDMEAVVLEMLDWRLLGVTTADFVDNMLAHLPPSGVPSGLMQTARRRADELVHAILTEVEFLDFEQSIVGLCVMQCILDETFPLQAALLMTVLRTILVVDTLGAQQCYKILVDLEVNPLPRCGANSPAGVLPDS